MRRKRLSVSHLGRVVRPSVVAMALLVVPAVVAGAAQQRPQFSTTVELVQLQVSVEGDDGTFAAGLGADDFRLYVDGDLRPVEVAYEVDLRPDTATAGIAFVDSGARAAPARRDTPRPVAARRHFLIFFDLNFTTRRGILEARRAALAFVTEQVHGEDLLAVATATRFGIQLLSPFTSNHGQARRAIGTLGLASATDQTTGRIPNEEAITQALAELAVGPAGGGGALEQLDAMEYREYVATVSNYTAQMRSFGEMMQAIEGRKHVVLFSRGFDDRAITGQTLGQLGAASEARAASPMGFAADDPEALYGSSEIRKNMTELIEQFRGADAVIHAVDPSGLRDSGVHDASRLGSAVTTNGASALASLRTGHQSLNVLAEGTDGSANWNMNDLSVALAEIESQTAAFYMLAYRKESTDPDVVDIRIEVVPSGARVVSAPTRLAPPPEYRDMNEMQRQLQLAEFMNDDVDRREIDFRAQVVAFPTDTDSSRAALVLQISGEELDRLATERGDDNLQLEIGAFALDEEGSAYDSFRRRVAVDVAGMRARGPLVGQDFRYADFVDVPPGDRRLRVLLRETEVGRLSSTTRRFYAPEGSDELTLVRPLVVSDSNAPPLPELDPGFDPFNFAGRRLVPVAAPELVLGESFLLLVTAFHVARDPATDQVLAGVVIEIEEDNLEGDVYPLRDVAVLGSTYDQTTDATSILIRARVPAIVRPGAARLWSRIIDTTSGNRVEEQAVVYVRGA